MRTVEGRADAASAVVPSDSSVPDVCCPECDKSVRTGTFLLRQYTFIDGTRVSYIHVECMQRLLTEAPTSSYDELRNEYLKTHASLV